MSDLIFACMSLDTASVRQMLLLAESLRRWGGELSDAPFWLLVPRGEEAYLEGFQGRLSGADVRIADFEVDLQAASFPFARKVLAAAEAERLAEDAASTLVWMDSGALILQSPAGLQLPRGIRLAARPVDLALIGSRYEEPPDAFWKLIYRECGVPEEQLYPMQSSVDRINIRPYFNAGLLAVQPHDGLLQAWRDDFLRLHMIPEFEPFYLANPRYRIFMHQAVLAGTLLARLSPAEILLLPATVNYPLHFHQRFPTAERPASLELADHLPLRDLVRPARLAGKNSTHLAGAAGLAQ